MCDRGFIWKDRGFTSNCEFECDKACYVGEYLDYENCKCRNKLVSPLLEECTETIGEVKLVKITLAKNENSYKCSFAQCVLRYFGYFLQLMLELFFILFILIGT